MHYLLCVKLVDWWKWWILVLFSVFRFPQWLLKKSSLQIIHLWSKMKCLPTDWVSFPSRLTLGCLNIFQVWLVFHLHDKFFLYKRGKQLTSALFRNLMDFPSFFSLSPYLKQMIHQMKRTLLSSNSMLAAIRASLAVQVTGTLYISIKASDFLTIFCSELINN